MVEELKACIAASKDIEDTRQDCDVARFLRDHGKALFALKAHAERYRFLRDTENMNGFWIARGKFGEGCSYWYGEPADSAIDAVMQSSKGCDHEL